MLFPFWHLVTMKRAQVDPAADDGGAGTDFSDGFESGNLICLVIDGGTGGGDLNVSTTCSHGRAVMGCRAFMDDNTQYMPVIIHRQGKRASGPAFISIRIRPACQWQCLLYLLGLIIRAARAKRICILQYFMGNYRTLRAGIVNDAWIPLLRPRSSGSIDAPTLIQIERRSSTAASANNGSLTLWINGMQAPA